MVRGFPHIGGDQQVRKRHLLRHFMLQLISLPRRQARDKHGMFFKNSGVSYREWAELTFPPLPKVAATRASSSQAMEEEFVEEPAASGSNDAKVIDTVVDILQRSRDIYEGYTSPLGIGFIVFGGGNYKPGAGACAALINGSWFPSAPGPGDGPNGEACPSSPGASSTTIAEVHSGGSSSGGESRRRRLDLHGGLDHYWVDPCR